MKNIYAVLEELEIPFTRYDHPAVFTVEDAEQYDRGGGAHSKNLFLRNKNGNHHYLVVLEAAKRINLKELQTLLGETKLSFASSERLAKYLGVTPGAVSPFGLINDVDNKVAVVVDNDLLNSPQQGFHPNLNTATLLISTGDFKKFLESTGNKIIYQNVI